MKRMTTAVLASIACIVLSACSPGGGTDSDGSAPTAGETPMPVLTLPPSAPPDPSTMSPESAATKPMSGEEAREHSRDCVMAAAGLASIALAPSAFIYGTDEEKLVELETQLKDMETQVPPALKPHITELESVVTKNLADPDDFHSEEFREASGPIELWLQNHCQR